MLRLSPLCSETLSVGNISTSPLKDSSSDTDSVIVEIGSLFSAAETLTGTAVAMPKAIIAARRTDVHFFKFSFINLILLKIIVKLQLL